MCMYTTRNYIFQVKCRPRSWKLNKTCHLCEFWNVGCWSDTPNLPTNITPTNIAGVKLYGKFPMDLGIPLLRIKIMLESNPLKFIVLVQRLAVCLFIEILSWTSPWRILRHYLWKNGFLSNPAPGENLRTWNLGMEIRCTYSVTIMYNIW